MAKKPQALLMAFCPKHSLADRGAYDTYALIKQELFARSRSSDARYFYLNTLSLMFERENKKFA